MTLFFTTEGVKAETRHKTITSFYQENRLWQSNNLSLGSHKNAEKMLGGQENSPEGTN
jgi:hypothetical protein